MKVEEISIIECCCGDVLASDVLNSSGAIIVAKDTEMNEYLIERLRELGITRVHIYTTFEDLENSNISSSEFKENYKDTMMQTKNLINELVSGKSLDYSKVSTICDQIYKNINFNSTIVECMTQFNDIDAYTYKHCVNTAFYSMLIAKWLKLPDHEINNIIQAGLLHDIGKSRIPNEILNKGDILTKDEYEIIKKHTVLGYQMIEDIDEIERDIKRAVLFHHERLDGSGYPLNILSNEIDLYPRIVAIADVFDAMTSDRVYKKRVTPFEAFEMFQTIGLRMFDTKVLKTFLYNLAAYLVGSRVLLSSNEAGEVVFIPPQDLTRPVIKVSSGYLDLSRENTIHILSMI